jgi:hypothetical protein
MKVFIALASPLLSGAALVKSGDRAFGPQNCVALTRSSAGSCVISTDCEGADLSTTDFAFDCIRQGGEIVRHSFGTGGFDPSEEFDTQVQCDRCETASPTDVIVKPVVPAKAAASPPKPAVQSEKPKTEVSQTVPAPVSFKAKHHHAAKSQATTEATVQATATATAKTSFWPFTSSSSEAEAKKDDVEVVKYGPNGCVSTWRSEEGHCIMRTNCKKADISKYEFGLVCVDKVGSPVRHLFGSDSFDPEETFDTLIKCDKCLGLEDIPDSVALNGEVVTLAKDISNLKAVMKNISINVQMLNAEVFKAAPAPAPAAASPAAALVARSTAYSRTVAVSDADQAVRKHNLRHSQRQRRHEDDEYDEDEADDRDADEHGESDVQEAVLRDDEDDDDDSD